MDSAVVTERVTRALKGDATVFSEVAADESHMGTTAVIVAIIGFVGGLLNGVFNDTTGIIGGAIGGIVGAYVAWVVGTGIFYALAKMFGGEGDFQGLMRGNAYAAVPSALGGIPFLGILIALWGVYLFILNVRENMALTMGKAAAVVLIPVAIVFLLVFLLAVFLVAALSGIG
ncbi:MAG: YIP1 family protein [Acidimicrobiia bacterium]|nr:YIP1 family protein [Acidimicrobiia bacterium]MDH5420700.1 YIP1 family protein [Acidimicrobiia bacterium]